MNLSQGKLADGLLGELLEVIYKYEESMILPTVLGILDIVKVQLIDDHMNAHEDDDDE
jgi:hypothetical protein